MANLRAYVRKSEGEAQALEGEPIRFVASTEGVKRDGLDLRMDRWRLENYRKNPVVLWAHDYMGRYLPIGKAEVTVEGKELLADVVFDQADDFARAVEGKYRRGFLNAVSVGWATVYEEDSHGERGEEWYDLLDVSAVPVPGDADALMEREVRGLREVLDGLEKPGDEGQEDAGPAPTGDERMAVEELRLRVNLIAAGFCRSGN